MIFVVIYNYIYIVLHQQLCRALFLHFVSITVRDLSVLDCGARIEDLNQLNVDVTGNAWQRLAANTQHIWSCVLVCMRL